MSTNTELIAEFNRLNSDPNATLTFTYVKQLADALESAEAELTRRDTVLSDLAAEFDANGNINDDSGEVAVWHRAADRVRGRLAAAPASIDGR